MVAVTFGILLAVSTWLTAALKPDCRLKPQHTLCLRPNRACQHISRGVDAAARARILKLHNHYRSLVARGQLPGFPPAADMQELLWHEELAEVAQAHAELCTDTQGVGSLKHDTDRSTTTFPEVGQNLAGRMSSAISPVDWDDSAKMWFNEYTDYPPNRVAAYDQSGISKAIGHFTQVIWAKSRYVGCGYLQYYVPNGFWKDLKLYTCNYGPSGNYRRQPVYQQGRTCSACPQPTTCNQTSGLCFDPQSSPRDRPSGSGGGEKRGDEKAVEGEKRSNEKAVGGEKRSDEKAMGGEKRGDEKSEAGEKRGDEEAVGGDKRGDGKAVAGEKRSDEKAMGGEKRSDEKGVGGEKGIGGDKRGDEKAVGGEKRGDENAVGGEKRGDENAVGGEMRDEEEALEDDTSRSSLWSWLPLVVGFLAGIAVCTAGMVCIRRRYAATEHVAAPQPGDQIAVTSESQLMTEQ